jgi:hypothetical protein
MHDAPQSTPTRIIVLGAERSGTSVVTEMVHRWGAYAGESDQLTGPSEQSPQGQWEWKPLWDLLVEVGDLPDGHSWWDTSFEEHIASKLRVPSIRSKAANLIAEMDRLGRPWVWKDPALCHFLAFWKPIWGDVVYVITVRHPYDVAKSWQRFVLPPQLQESADLVPCNLLRWQHMMLTVLQATDDTDRRIFVEYEAYVRQPLVEARRLARFLDAQSQSASTDEPTILAMAQAVNPTFWRNRTDRPPAEIAEMMPAQRALYSFLRDKLVNPDAQPSADFPMPLGWREFVGNAESIPPSV